MSPEQNTLPLSNTVWTGKSKEGAISRDITFIASSQIDANTKFAKYIELKNRSSFKKAIVLGSCRPFAMDLDKEIEKIERQNDREDMA